MIYQKMLMDSKPYYISVSRCADFQSHRHHEIELDYCLKGSFYIKIENRNYLLKKGDIALIGSMMSHELSHSEETCKYLVIEIGPVFLKEYFQKFANAIFEPPVYSLQDGSSLPDRLAKSLTDLLEETAQEYEQHTDASEMTAIGNIYKLCAYIQKEFIEKNADAPKQSKNFRNVLKIEKALHLIYSNYTENITVDDAAALIGYKKNSFCKLFKRVTGESFHKTLNRHRIDTACYLLTETTTPVNEAATAVGFADAKTFCRVFKEFTGITPGQYRQHGQTKSGVI